jgi:hypothetical protein
MDGMNEAAAFVDPIMVEFRISAGSKPIGSWAQGWVQELITNQWVLTPPLGPPEFPPDWPSWVPPEPTPTFYRYGCMLYDLKTNGQIWAGLLPQAPVGAAYYRYRQHFQYVWVTPCNEVKVWPLGNVIFERYRFDDNLDDKWAYRPA